MTDILVESFDVNVGAGGTTHTLSNAGSSVSSMLLRHNGPSSKLSGGPTGSAGNAGPHITGVGIELTDPSTITWRRGASSSTTKVMGEAWRYTGSPGGDNEFISRGIYALTLTSSSESQAVSGISDVSKCVPFLLGVTTSITSVQEHEKVCVGVRMDGSGNVIVSRGQNVTNAVTVYVQVVEFTGSNWTIATATSSSHDTGSETVTLSQDIGNWANAWIEGSMEGDAGGETGLSDVHCAFIPGASTTQAICAPQQFGDANARNDSSAYLYVISNPDVDVYHDTQINITEGNGTYGTANWPSSAPTDRDLDKLALSWYPDTTGVGTAWARGCLQARITNATGTIQQWVHRSGNDVDAAYAVIDLSRLVSSSDSLVSSNLESAANLRSNVLADSIALANLHSTVSADKALLANLLSVISASSSFVENVLNNTGTLYWAVYLSATSDPDDATIIAQSDGNYLYGSDTSPTTTTTGFQGASLSGLSAGTEYKLACVWNDGSTSSNVCISSAFTTSGGTTVVNADLQTLLSLAQLVNADSGQQANLKALVLRDASLIANLAGLVSVDSQLLAGLSEAVGSDSALSANLSEIVAQDAGLLADIRSLVDQDLSLLSNIISLSLVGANLTALANIAELVSADKISPSSIRGLTQSDAALIADIQALVSSDAGLIASLSELSTSSIGVLYNIIATGLVGSNLGLVSNLAELIGAGSSTPYGIRELVGSNNVLVGSLRELLISDVDIEASIRERAGASLGLLANLLVANLVSSDLSATYQMAGLAVSDAALSSSLLGLVKGDLLLPQRVLIAVAQDVELTHRILINVGQGSAHGYSLAELAASDLDQRYRILVIVTERLLKEDGGLSLIHFLQANQLVQLEQQNEIQRLIQENNLIEMDKSVH